MITYKDRSYPVIRQFDCRVLDIGFKKGGGFCTVFPISNKQYREDQALKGYKMPDKVEVITKDKTTEFHITCDWGDTHIVTIDNCHSQEIQDAISAAKEQGLIQESGRQ